MLFCYLYAGAAFGALSVTAPDTLTHSLGSVWKSVQRWARAEPYYSPRAHPTTRHLEALGQVQFRNAAFRRWICIRRLVSMYMRIFVHSIDNAQGIHVGTQRSQTVRRTRNSIRREYSTHVFYPRGSALQLISTAPIGLGQRPRFSTLRHLQHGRTCGAAAGDPGGPPG
jgi:hypothetical protein